jgi:hypothetical protein
MEFVKKGDTFPIYNEGDFSFGEWVAIYGSLDFSEDLNFLRNLKGTTIFAKDSGIYVLLGFICTKKLHCLGIESRILNLNMNYFEYSGVNFYPLSKLLENFNSVRHRNSIFAFPYGNLPFFETTNLRHSGESFPPANRNPAYRYAILRINQDLLLEPKVQNLDIERFLKEINEKILFPPGTSEN